MNEEPSTRELFAQLTSDIKSLVSNEVALAKKEMSEASKRATRGGVLAAVGLVFILLMLIMLSFAYAEGLIAAGLAPIWAFLIVAGTYLLLAGILFAVAVYNFRRANPAATITASIQESIALFKRLF